MPEIASIGSIRITMYYDDHNPPHFHAEYGGQKAIVDIQKARILQGALPAKQLKIVLGWTVMHHDELMIDWDLARQSLPLKTISTFI